MKNGFEYIMRHEVNSRVTIDGYRYSVCGSFSPSFIPPTNMLPKHYLPYYDHIVILFFAVIPFFPLFLKKHMRFTGGEIFRFISV